jgi:alcohol dehydrogenase class IV
MGVAVYDRWPRRMLVGEGSVKQLPDEIRGLGAKKILLITDTGIVSLPFIVEIRQNLCNAGFDVYLFGEIRPHPTEQNVIDAVEIGRQFGADILVSVGGGSSMDAGRGIKAILTYGGNIRDHMPSTRKIVYDRKDMLPHIAIPTTAGTGGEVAGGGAIYGPDLNTGEMMEIAISDANLVPDVAILDPLLTLTLPAYPTAFTGMDVLTHAIESIFSTKDFALSDALAYEVIRLVEENLRKAVKEPSNLAAREAMLVAAMMATVAFTQTRLGLCHSMAMSLSVMADVPHGTGNALLLPRIFRLNAKVRGDRAIRIAEAFGVERGTPEEMIRQASDKITKLLVDTGLPVYLDDTAFTRDMIDKASKMAKECGFTITNPIIPTIEDISRIYKECFR